MIYRGRSFLLAGALALSVGFGASGVMAKDFTFKDETAFNEAVKGFIMKNPEVIFESIEQYRAREEENAQKQAMEQIAENAAYLARPDAPSVGNPDADVTIIEFFDYNCGYCKRALPDIQKALEKDKNLRVVFKDLAVLGPSSETAALWSLAAHKQDKYFEYHVALMEHRGPKNEKELMKLAEKTGLDAEQLKKDAASDEIRAMLEKDAAIAEQIGVRGTPAFIIGSQFIPGYVGESGLMKAIEEERAKAKDKEG